MDERTGRWNRWRATAATGLVALLVLAGCGGGDDNGGDDPPEGTTVSAPASPRAGSVSVEIVDEASPTTAASDPVAASPAGSPRAGQGGGSGRDRTVTVTLTDYRVNATRTAFRTNRDFTFVVQNNGDEAHQFVIERKGANGEPLEADGEVARIDSIPAGEQATLVWSFAEPGDYQIACHLADHYDLGMVLDTITVTERDAAATPTG